MSKIYHCGEKHLMAATYLKQVWAILANRLEKLVVLK